MFRLAVKDWNHCVTLFSLRLLLRLLLKSWWPRETRITVNGGCPQRNPETVCERHSFTLRIKVRSHRDGNFLSEAHSHLQFIMIHACDDEALQTLQTPRPMPMLMPISMPMPVPMPMPPPQWWKCISKPLLYADRRSNTILSVFRFSIPSCPKFLVRWHICCLHRRMLLPPVTISAGCTTSVPLW